MELPCQAPSSRRAIGCCAEQIDSESNCQASASQPEVRLSCRGCRPRRGCRAIRKGPCKSAAQTAMSRQTGGRQRPGSGGNMCIHRRRRVPVLHLTLLLGVLGGCSASGAISSLIPTAGHAVGGYPISISGQNFATDGSQSYFCTFSCTTGSGAHPASAPPNARPLALQAGRYSCPSFDIALPCRRLYFSRGRGNCHLAPLLDVSSASLGDVALFCHSPNLARNAKRQLRSVEWLCPQLSIHCGMDRSEPPYRTSVRRRYFEMLERHRACSVPD